MESGITKQQVDTTAQHLALGAVAVVGAGLSIDSRFPMTGGLNTLLWDALDHDLPARQAVARTLERPDAPSKQLIGDTWADILIAWEAVANAPIARGRFQNQFSSLDKERAARRSPAHEALARLIHVGVVERVVSLNWDTALEKAYLRLYGVPVPREVLHKPHGDAADAETPWTFPHEPGRVPAQVTATVRRLAEGHARTLLIIGYSERDRVVVEQLVQPLDETWRTIRIGPSATGPNDLGAGAEVVLPQMAEPYARREDRSSWHTVTYQGRRDITAALRGERLDPRDVEDCPELAEVDLLTAALRTEHSVVMNGPAGSGKSISAYQALRRLADAGFETLRLRDDARDKGMRIWLEDLRAFPRPKALLLDDAQDMSPDTVRELAEHAGADTLVLVVGIDHVAGGVRTLRLGAGSAVARLAHWVRNERQTLFPLIRALDDNVGNHPGDLNFNRRIEAAERQATPWQFFYTLTGGWRRIRHTALELRDIKRADLLLLVVAAAQIAGVDAGVSHPQLEVLTRSLGRSGDWLETSLAELRRRGQIIESDGHVRCAHLQTAYNVVRWMMHPQPWNTTARPRPEVQPIESAAPAPNPDLSSLSEPATDARSVPPDVSISDIKSDRDAVGVVFQTLLDDASTPLRGLAWLAGRGLDGDVRGLLRWMGVFGPNRDKQLASRSLATPETGDVAAAAQLLSDTIMYADGDVISYVQGHNDRVREWYESISPENAWALGDLVNTLHASDEKYAAQVARYADPVRMSRLALEGGWPHSVSTGHALDRICNEGGVEIRTAIRPHLMQDEYIAMLDTGKPEFWRVITFITDLLSVEADFALQLFTHAAPALARQFEADPVRHWIDLTRFVIHVGYGPQFLRGGRKHPVNKVRVAVRTFLRSIDQTLIAATISRPNEQWGEANFYSFVDLLSEADPAGFSAITNLVDLASYESLLFENPERPSRTTLYVLHKLHEKRPDEVHSILERLEPGLLDLDAVFAYMAPDIAARALRRGLPLDLGLDNQRWDSAALILAEFYAYDPAIAAELARSNKESLAHGLTASTWHNPWENLRLWVAACDSAAPGLIDEVISELPPGAVAGWDRALGRPTKNSKSHKADIAPLVLRAATQPGHVGEEASKLLKRFSSLNK